MDGPPQTSLNRAVSNSSLAEVSWVSGDGRPRVRGVIALLRGDRPALAFTYAGARFASDLARVPRAALTLSERRSTGAGFSPTLLAGRPSLLEDPTGQTFVADLLIQELRRFPPSRLFADSPLLMREHWWFLPRLIVELDVDTVEPLPERAGPYDHLLVVADGPVAAVRVVACGERVGDLMHLDLAGGRSAPAPGEAVVFGQDASFPDLDQWEQWRYAGRWDGTGLVVAAAPARTGLGPPPGLMQRWRRQRAFQRRCVEAIPRS